MNLVQLAVQHGGKLAPIVIPEGLTSGTGLMNPSIFIDEDGDILVNLRHVNYTLYHSENKQRFPSRWGPLSYLHPEKDQRLGTTNYLCRLNDALEMTDYALVNTSKFDVPPLWEFTGEEDCRVVQWYGKLYLVGVRRDTTTNGQGRMEYSQIKLDKKAWTATEISRSRIPTPGENLLKPRAQEAYCEKNWVPVLDKPYQFIKWASPVEVVKALEGKGTNQVSLRPELPNAREQRGSSQVVRWGNVYISITHQTNNFKNYLGQKDGIYTHKLCVWDDQLNMVGVSQPFKFLDARIEFCAGAAVHNGDLLISFGFQDNAAFVLRTPKAVVEDLIMEALSYEG
ncbi:hypothetical protein UFOVP965_19 [uncultured Caudovirales phage]|uniref:Uncharacterized protein n=1 Tax=uncultured Caudovirales phage TaxID=2100421 RepID=A0A6J5QWL7_9CAUD|nr:hypothetical protein UFOVP965_19 [uncultured Caudovirales phage]CAB4179717.1 hypothetical protein UFOVP1035_15 [uncultured Caudovirales phage]CAB4188833.1 hypothetical protein UFOVP1181_121 [uncultured Caudovirales phage]